MQLEEKNKLVKKISKITMLKNEIKKILKKAKYISRLA